MTELSHHTQNIIYNSPYGNLPEDPYWLTFEEQGVNDAASLADVATLVDTLYDINPCVNTDTTGVDSVSTANTDPQTTDEITAMQEKLFADAYAVMGIKACDLDLYTGNYTVDVKIRCSHPDIPYKLHLSTIGGILAALGDPDLVHGLPVVKSIVRNTEQIDVTVDVKNASSVVLPSPVILSAAQSISNGMLNGYNPIIRSGSLRANWLGTPIQTGTGLLDTTIRSLHNTLYWTGQVSGTIVANYLTTYDIVTILVPGIRLKDSTEWGTQEATILAFYHSQVYSSNITAPAVDKSIDIPTKDLICNPTKVGSGNLNEPKGDKDKTEYGCQLIDDGLADKELYKRLCCHYPTGSLKNCAESTAALPAHKLTDQEKKDMTPDPGPGGMSGTVSFVAVPPCGTEGCGKKITTVSLNQHLCCLEVPPLSWDPINSVQTLIPGHSGYVFVTGGYPPYYWKIRGYGFAIGDNYHREWSTDVPFVKVFALSMACGFAPITVSDGCTEVNGGVRSTTGNWYGLGSFFINDLGLPITNTTCIAGLHNSAQGTDLSRFSGDGRYFLNIPAGVIGTPGYAALYSDSSDTIKYYGVGHNNPCDIVVIDPIVKVFQVHPFFYCSYYNDGLLCDNTLALSINYPQTISEWRC